MSTEKRFWLICVTIPMNRRKEDEVIPKYQLYRVSTDDPGSVTVPINTVAFGFLESDKSEEEILSRLGVFKVNNSYGITGTGKTYVPGNVIKDKEGHELIFNRELRCAFMITSDNIIPYN